VAAPAPYLAQVQAELAGTSIGVGAQDVSQHEQGAFTGELRPPCSRSSACAMRWSVTPSVVSIMARPMPWCCQGPGRAGQGHHAHRLRGRDPGGARSGSDRSRGQASAGSRDSSGRPLRERAGRGL
jgi:hypothetical protein